MLKRCVCVCVCALWMLWTLVCFLDVMLIDAQSLQKCLSKNKNNNKIKLKIKIQFSDDGRRNRRTANALRLRRFGRIKWSSPKQRQHGRSSSSWRMRQQASQRRTWKEEEEEEEQETKSCYQRRQTKTENPDGFRRFGKSQSWFRRQHLQWMQRVLVFDRFSRRRKREQQQQQETG